MCHMASVLYHALRSCNSVDGMGWDVHYLDMVLQHTSPFGKGGHCDMTSFPRVKPNLWQL